MARGSTALLLLNRRKTPPPPPRKKLNLHLPYHKLDQIREDEDGDSRLEYFKSYQEEDTEEEESEGGEEESKFQSAAAARVEALRRRSFNSSSNMSTFNANRSFKLGGVARRRNRWRRMRVRICRVRLLNWLSPMEFLKKLRKAYIQAISSKESQCGLVMMGSPWSFPVVVPFRGV